MYIVYKPPLLFSLLIRICPAGKPSSPHCPVTVLPVQVLSDSETGVGAVKASEIRMNGQLWWCRVATIRANTVKTSIRELAVRHLTMIWLFDGAMVDGGAGK